MSINNGLSLDLLLSSSQKLSYLRIGLDKLPILPEEAESFLKKKMRPKDYMPKIRMLESHSSREQITQYQSGFFTKLKYTWSIHKHYEVPLELFGKIQNLMLYFHDHVSEQEDKITLFTKFKNMISRELSRRNRQLPTTLSAICVVPLPHFLSYSNFPEDRGAQQEENTTVIPYKPESAFIRIATNQNENSIFRQGDTVLEVLLEYKWKKFIRRYFMLMYAVYLIYYISFSVGVSFAREVFHYELGAPVTSHGQIGCFVLMFLSVTFLMYQEFRQFIKSYNKIGYIASLYNWIDWLAFSLPLASFALLLKGGTNFVSKTL